MSQRAEPPFRADHVGSLLRPRALLDAREQFAAGTLGRKELRAAEDAAIVEPSPLQERIGLQAATDGEFRRTSWHMDFIYQLGGITKTDEQLRVCDAQRDRRAARSRRPGWRSPGRSGSSSRSSPTTSASSPKQVTTAVPKLTIPSPSMVHYRAGTAAVDRSVYPDLEEFWADLSAAYADEVRALAGLGCRYLQLDDTSLAYLNDPAQRAAMAARGEDADHQHLRYIRQINAAIADRPADLRVTTHMCRGNYRSSWAAEGGYDHVAEALFGELAVDGFFCEFDDERSGGFEPLRFVPPGKQVVLGLVTTKSGELEDADALKRRIDEAAKYVPLDQLCLSPQCGFSSTVEGNALTGTSRGQAAP